MARSGKTSRLVRLFASVVFGMSVTILLTRLLPAANLSSADLYSTADRSAFGTFGSAGNVLLVVLVFTFLLIIAAVFTAGGDRERSRFPVAKAGAVAAGLLAAAAVIASPEGGVVHVAIAAAGFVTAVGMFRLQGHPRTAHHAKEDPIDQGRRLSLATLGFAATGLASGVAISVPNRAAAEKELAREWQKRFRYDVTDHGLVADGVTDNFPALTALIAQVQEGDEIFFPPTPLNTYYGFSNQIVINKSIKLSGNWNRGTIDGPLMGSILGPTDVSSHLSMASLIKVATSRVRIEGIAVRGKPTKETASTVSINGSTLAMKDVSVSAEMVGARVSGKKIPMETTVASVDVGANSISLSQPMAGAEITGANSDDSGLTFTFASDHDFNVGDKITTSGFSPAAYDGDFTVSAVVNWQTIQVRSGSKPEPATVVGTYEGLISGCSVWLGADGIEFDGDAEQAHFCNLAQVCVLGFGQGISIGSADHITFSDGCEIGSCYDAVGYLQRNKFDFSFIDCLLVGNVRSSQHVGADTQVVNLSCIRTHLGWAEYGIFQDVSTATRGVKGLSMIASPIESVSKRHISLVNGGGMLLDAAGYWTWTNGAPNGPAFSISGEQNTGDINFMTALEGENLNCPYLFYVGVQSDSSRIRMLTNLSRFAATAFKSPSYNEDSMPQTMTNKVFNSATLHQPSISTIQSPDDSGIRFQNREGAVYFQIDGSGRATSNGIEIVTAQRAINSQLGTAYTLESADAGHLLTFDSAEPVTLTVPINSVVSFPVGTFIDLLQLGLGQVSIDGPGITFLRATGSKISGQFGTATLTKLATDTWLLTGDLTA